ncbi:CBS domain-containing protein [Streptomyces sp. NPDC050674]|uniref:CBS domain-containing protein n=1 Tax=Streptomyces sp. NPDC050674 TaxID=3157216 RepID=UPI003445BE3D
MQHAKIGSVMSTEVVRVAEGTPVEEAARMLAVHRTGLFVVDEDDRMIGVVTDADLRAHEVAAPGPGGWRRFRFVARATTGRRRGGPAPRTAGQVMRVPPVPVHAEDTVVKAARAMAGRGVERLPVLDEEGRLVGVLSHRDLLQVFARSDEDIRDEVVDEVFVRALWLMPRSVDVSVSEGVVMLAGGLELRSEKEFAVAMTWQIDGVVAVVDRLTWRLDDTRLRADERTLRCAADDWLREL